MAERGGATDLGQSRLRIAAWMLVLSAGGIIVASFVAIITAESTERADTTRMVFTSVLPLLGTWVGTILAFYFARENLEAATDSTIRLSGRLAPTTPVTDVMIPRAKFVAEILAAGADPGAVRLADLQAKMTQAGHRRIPILDASDAVVYVVHDATIAKFAEQRSMSVAALRAESMTDLLSNADLRGQVEAIGVVGPTATVADARTAMRVVKDSNDVFVTKDGQRMGQVHGWLTNTDLASTD